jgi:hypothetical protein
MALHRTRKAMKPIAMPATYGTKGSVLVNWLNLSVSGGCVNDLILSPSGVGLG